MKNHLWSSLLFSTILIMTGCNSVKMQKFSPYSEGLPSGHQWKCNPEFGDVNNDGLLDLAAIPRKGKGVRVWINSGKGSWEESSTGLIRQFSCGGGVAFGDIDSDGFLDLAVGDHCQGVFVYKGDGNGGWSNSSEGLPYFLADDVALDDFNGDGNLDLVACSASDQGISLYTGNGNGSWHKASSTGLPESDDCHELALGDYNHDGIPDIAATMVENPRVWISNAEGSWTESSSGLPQTSWGGQFWGIASGDVNNDGHSDLALGRTVKGPEVYLGDGKGKWTPALEGLSPVKSAWGVALGDINGDKLTDLIVSGKKELEDKGDVSGIFYFQGDGSGRWNHIDNSGLPQSGMPQSWGVAIADLENDGTSEICGCFGSGRARMIPYPGFNSESDYEPGNIKGIRGSIRVWKQN